MIVAVKQGKVRFFDSIHAMKALCTEGRYLVCKILDAKLATTMTQIANKKSWLTTTNIWSAKVIDCDQYYDIKTLHVVDMIDCSYHIDSYLIVNDILTENDLGSWE